MPKRPPELDPELRQLFSEEAEQKANEISQGIAECELDRPELEPQLDRLVWLQMRFSEYSGMANTLGLYRSGHRCALVVDELTQVIGGAHSAEDSLPALFDRALESIDDALAYLHNQDVEPSLLFELEDDETTVAEQLPRLDFPALKNLTGADSQVQDAADGLVQRPPSGVDQELYEVFLDEADELLAGAEKAWNDWRQGLHSSEALKELRRVFHTLKGGARLTKMQQLGDYVHAAEGELEEAEQPKKTDAVAAATRKTLDCLNQAFSALRSGQTATLLKPNMDGAKAPRPAATAAKANQPTAKDSQNANNERQFIRIRSKQLEALRLRANEVNALRSQIQQSTSALETEQTISSQSILEASALLKDARFALERLIEKLPSDSSGRLSDAQLESQIALQTLEDMLLKLSRQHARSSELCKHIERTLQGQSKAGSALNEHILNTRLVPFGDFEARLQGIIRQTQADFADKHFGLEISGGQLDVDRQLIEQLLPALEHLLRNAVAHGIESETERRRLGKTPNGLIQLQLRKLRGKLEIQLRDDGRGLALDKIKNKALDLGLINERQTLSQRSLERLIFHPGLSAADSVDQLAGRGVGMDVVEHLVHGLGGNIDLSTETNKGCVFKLQLPMGETALNAVLVTVGNELYAVPQNDIRSVTRLNDQTLAQAYQAEQTITAEGYSWTAKALASFVGLEAGLLPSHGQSFPALLVQAEQHRYAVVVERCLDSAEYRLETLPPAVTGILGISGAVLLEDGRVAPVLDLPSLCASDISYQRQTLQTATQNTEQSYRLMVVEDSPSWQRQLQQGLAHPPFEVLCCEDGQAALDQINDYQPDLVLVDMQMPRMDGLEFLQRLRRNPKLANIPAVIFSSVTGSSQRRRAQQLGAKSWVSKNANLNPLLNAINQELGLAQPNTLNNESA